MQADPSLLYIWAKLDFFYQNQRIGDFLVVQGLRLCTSTARGTGLIPDWGTRILHAARGSARKERTKLKLYTYVEITATAELYPQFTLDLKHIMNYH